MLEPAEAVAREVAATPSSVTGALSRILLVGSRLRQSATPPSTPFVGEATTFPPRALSTVEPRHLAAVPRRNQANTPQARWPCAL
jgi:hypothetical protein